MKKYGLLMVVAFGIFCLLVSPANAQYQAQGLKGGLAIGATTGNTDADGELTKLNADAVGIQIELVGTGIPSSIVKMFPFLLALVSLVIASGTQKLRSGGGLFRKACDKPEKSKRQKSAE